MIRVKDANGTEALVTQAAYDQVWKHKGFTLIEVVPVIGGPVDEPKAKKKATK